VSAVVEIGLRGFWSSCKIRGLFLWGGPLPSGEGGAKRRVRAGRSDQSYFDTDVSWGDLPSSGASRHLLPEGEGLAQPFPQRGVTTVYFLLFSFVIFGLLVMATDFGRFYLIQGELQTAADAAALAAASRLNGTVNAQERASDQITASFDTTTNNDNRFNLRMNQIGTSGSDLVTTTQIDYFSTLSDAQTNVNGGQTGGVDWSSGFYPKYVRVQITAQSPVIFASLLNRSASRPTIATSAVAGVSAPICSACGIDGLAVVDQSAGADPVNFGFTPSTFYTLFLVRSQRTGGPVAAPPQAGTTTAAPYVVLNHTPSGPADLDVDGSLFEFGAGGLSTSTGLTTPANVAINTSEVAYTVTGSNTTGQDVLCGLNVRFAVDPSTNNCAAVDGGQFTALSPLYPADSDVGAATYAAGAGLQDYAMEYDGNLRRILTVAIVDAADSLNVLNFRQFLIEAAPVSATISQGLNTTQITGAFRAQYIGALVPVRCGGVGGVCTVTAGIGRAVLH
jgi:Flp pilus assembly protein TadG